MPDVTEANTVQDVDEALAFLSAGLHAARVTGNAEQELDALEALDLLLDRRKQLAGGE